MNEKICPRCGSKQIVSATNHWRLTGYLGEPKGGVAFGDAVDSRYICESCGLVGIMVEKDGKIGPKIFKDLKEIKKALGTRSK